MKNIVKSVVSALIALSVPLFRLLENTLGFSRFHPILGNAESARAERSFADWLLYFSFIAAMALMSVAVWIFTSRAVFGIRSQKPRRPILLSFVLMSVAEMVYVLVFLLSYEFSFSVSGGSLYFSIQPYLLLILPLAYGLLAVVSQYVGGKTKVLCAIFGIAAELFYIYDTLRLLGIFVFGLSFIGWIITVCFTACRVGYIYYWIQVIRGKMQESDFVLQPDKQVSVSGTAG